MTEAEFTALIESITARLEGLADLDAEALTELSTDIRAAYETAREAGPADKVTGEDHYAMLASLKDGLASVTTRKGEVVAETQAASDALDALDADVEGLTVDPSELAPLADLSADEVAVLAALTPEQATELQELVARLAELADIASEGDEPPAEDEEGSEAKAEPVVQAASVGVLPSRVNLPTVVQPQPAETKAAKPLARSWDDERPLDLEGVGRAMQIAASRYGKTPDREVRVASILADEDLDRLSGIDDLDEWHKGEMAKLREYRGQMASNVRQAAGALCAPNFQDYSLLVLGSEEQPIGALFPRAGGSSADNSKTLGFSQALRFSSFVNSDGDTWGDDSNASAGAETVGIGSATATENALATDNALSPYPKTMMRAACPARVTCEQRAVWLGLVFNNLNAASWPEFVTAVQEGGRIAMAKELEEWRLEDWYDAADTANTVLSPISQPWSGTHNLTQTIISVVTHDRSRNRDWNAPYVAAIPAWLEASLVTETLAMLDISSGNMSVEDARLEILRRYNITVASYLDRFGKSADANETSNDVPTLLPAPTEATLLFPCAARIGIARDDAGFVRVGEELNLGVLRTQADLENNDFTIFEEAWSRLCFRIPPYVVDVQVNPSATVSNIVSVIADNCSGSGS